jgi:ElaB/YqjD/DUF883 family membrane-anchored ribosome-binding protein
MTDNDRTTNAQGNSGNGADAATGPRRLAQTDYGQHLANAAGQARDFVSDKVALVTDKIRELEDADLGEVIENAKDFARKKPGQAILISAAAGLVLGLLLRSGRR